MGMIWFRDFGATFHPITRIGFPNVSSNMGWLDMTCLILDEWKNSITWDGWTVSYSSNYNSMKCARKMQFTFLPVDLLIFNDLFCLTLVWCSIFPSFASSILLEVPFLMPFLSFSDAIWTSCYCRCFESYHGNPTATISTSWTDVFGKYSKIYFIPTDWLNLHIEGYGFWTMFLYCSLSETGVRIFNSWYHMLRSPVFSWKVWVPVQRRKGSSEMI